MTAARRRFGRALLVTALAGALALGPAVAASAALVPAVLTAPVIGATTRSSTGPCGDHDTTSVTVVVDFHELGGGVNAACTDGPVRDGADALDKAGIAWQGTARWGRGFVCKIAGKPSSAPCIDTPPASAYWSYWLGVRGGGWCYSNLGVTARKPPPGTVEGWSFSQGRSSAPPPGSPPPALAAGVHAPALNPGDCDPAGPTTPTTPTTSSPATHPPATRPPTTAPAGGGGPAPGDSGSSGSSGPGPGHGTTTAPESTPDAGPKSGSKAHPTTAAKGTGAPATTPDGRAATTSAGSGRDGDSDQQAGGSVPINHVDLGRDGSSGGLPVSTLVGIALVVVLGSGALVGARRRHTAAGPPGPGTG